VALLVVFCGLLVDDHIELLLDSVDVLVWLHSVELDPASLWLLGVETSAKSSILILWLGSSKNRC